MDLTNKKLKDTYHQVVTIGATGGTYGWYLEDGVGVELPSQLYVYTTELVDVPENGDTCNLKIATQTTLNTVLDETNSFYIGLPTPVKNKVNESVLIFKTGATLPTITQPVGIIWFGTTLTLAINKTAYIYYNQVLTGDGWEIHARGDNKA